MSIRHRKRRKQGVMATKRPITLQPKTETISLADGISITLSQATFPMSLRLTEIENEMKAAHAEEFTEGKEITSLDNARIIFDLFFYPKIAAAVVDKEVPSADEMYTWPMAEIEKVFAVAESLNPQWFEGLNKVALGAVTLDEAKNA